MITKRFKSLVLLSFVISIIILFNSCLMGGVEKAGSRGSVAFTVDEALARKIAAAAEDEGLSPRSAGSASYRTLQRSSGYENLFIDVSIKGDFEDSKTIQAVDDSSASFTSIPVGSSIYVEATAYYQEGEKRTSLFEGQSKTFKVREGENQVVFVLKRVNSDGSTQGNGGPGGGGSGGGGNEPDPVLTIDFYVSAAGGSATGEGTETDPLDTIAHAAEKLNDRNKDWVIGIDGLLSDVQILMDDPSSGPYLAKSITLLGVSGNAANDGIDAGWDGVSTPTGNVGSALTVKTTVPVTLRKLTIKGGDAENGGGLYMSKSPCSVTLIKSYVTGNAAVKDGGGIFVEQGTLTMKSGGINSNKTVYVYGLSGSSAGNGGGVLLFQGGSIFDMQGGTVNSNEAASYGGAVYLNCRGTYGSGSFIMSGGSISGNDCDYPYGDALYLPAYNNKSSPAYFEMSGSAVIAGNNDVFLGSDGFYEEVITIAGPLTGETPVATITGQGGDPELAPGYQNHQVLSATGSGSLLSSYTKFAVKDCGSTPYYIDASGCLTTSQPQILNLYIKQGGSGSGTSESSPFGSIQEAADYIASNGTPGTVANIKISGDLSGSQQLQGIDNTKASAIIIEGANGVGTNGMPKDALTGGYGVEKTLTINVSASDYSHHVPVTIQNLKINGAAEHGLYVGDGNGTYWNEVYLESGTLITNNGSGTGNYDGAGIYIDDNAAVVVKDGCTISDNAAGRNGGGIYVLGYLDLYGGTISDNTAVINGNGIYASAPASGPMSNGITMMAGASVASNNDIYICTDTGIFITEPLSSNGTVATITPETYSSSVQVLYVRMPVGAQSSVNLADECQKFNVTTASDGSTWALNEDGELYKVSGGTTGPVTYYVAPSSGGGSSSGDGSVNNPFNTISAAYAACETYCRANTTPNTFVIKVDGILTEGQSIYGSYSLNNHTIASVTIEGKNGLSGGVPQDGIVVPAGANDQTALDINGYVMTLNQIIIKNFKLTSEKGTGLELGGDWSDEDRSLICNVILDEGALITGCNSGRGASVIGRSRLNMKAGSKITGNANSGGNGGGVYLEGGTTLDMQGGEISSNTADYGSGVYVSNNGEFIINNSALVASTNDVYLASGGMVSIGGPLTVPGGATYMAVITPQSYTPNTPVLGLAVDHYDENNGHDPVYIDTTTIGNEHAKFAVTPNGTTNYEIDTEGKLQLATGGSGGGGTGGIVVTSNLGGNGMITPLSSSAPVRITISNDVETIDFTKLKIKVGSNEYVSDSLRDFKTTGDTDNENSYEFSFGSSLTGTGTEIIIYYDENEIERLSVMRLGNTG